MKIAIIGLALTPITGGVETHTWELSKHLAKKGHDVHLFGIHNYKGRVYPKEELISNVNIHRISKPLQVGRYNFWEWAEIQIARKLINLDKVMEFDLYHAHSVFPPGLSAYLASMKSGKPYLITSHGIEIMLWSKFFLYQKWRQLFIKRIFSKSSAVIGVSKELQHLSIKYGANEDKTYSLPNATNLDQFTPQPINKTLRERLGYSPDDIIVLSLRRLVPKNGVRYLVECGRYLYPKHSNIKFLICGNGPELESIKFKAKELNIEQYYNFRGSINNEIIDNYINSSDMAVFPSLAEATSIACLECMASGKPVITSNVGGLPEIIENNKTGIQVDFIETKSSFVDYGLPENVIKQLSNAIAYLAENPSERNRLGNEAHKQVKLKYTWTTYIKKIESIYNSIINNQSKS